MSSTRRPPGSEHRRHQRVDSRERIWCEGDDITLYAQTMNVSEEGVFVRTASPLPPGRRLHISLTELPEGEVVGEAEVMWTRPAGSSGSGMGLRIVRFELGEDALRRYVERAIRTSLRPRAE